MYEEIDPRQEEEQEEEFTPGVVEASWMVIMALIVLVGCSLPIILLLLVLFVN